MVNTHVNFKTDAKVVLLFYIAKSLEYLGTDWKRLEKAASYSYH